MKADVAIVQLILKKLAIIISSASVEQRVNPVKHGVLDWELEFIF